VKQSVPPASETNLNPLLFFAAKFSAAIAASLRLILVHAFTPTPQFEICNGIKA
jgi:hypothetical protein